MGQGASTSAGRSTLGRAACAVIAGLLMALPVLDARACSTCGCTLNTDLGNQGVQGGTGWRLDFRYDLVDQTQLRSGANSISVPIPEPYEVEQRTRNAYYDFDLDYGFSRSWGLNLQLPYVGRFHTTYDVGDTRLSTSDYTHELSDVRLLGRYTGFSPDMSDGLLFGLKLPTGNTNQRFVSGPDQGQLVDPTLQPGTGTTDAMLGGYHFGELPVSMGWFAQAMFQHALDSHDAYAPGDTINLNAGLRFYWGDWLTPQLQLNYQIRARDRGAAADSADTGGRVLYLSPGVTVAFDSGWHGFLFLQLPVHEYVNGLQLTPRRIISLGASYRFR